MSTVVLKVRQVSFWPLVTGLLASGRRLTNFASLVQSWYRRLFRYSSYIFSVEKAKEN